MFWPSAMTVDSVHRLTAHGYDVTVDGGNGASLTSLRWQKPNGEWFEILHPCPPALVARTGGCFVMAPFANRLDRGHFSSAFGHVPINRPEADLAIHGFSRDRAWRLVEASETHIILADDFAEAGNPFAYGLTQCISVGSSGIEFSLHLTNRAKHSLPYGFGFHPWFRKTADTWLSFKAAIGLSPDERSFAVAPKPASEGPAFSTGIDVSAMPWFDGHYSGWTSRTAMVEWRPEQVRMVLQATGALSNLHVYVPDTLQVLCVEPVSHVPNVHNRPELAPYGDVTLLKPGEALEGAMILNCAARP